MAHGEWLNAVIAKAAATEVDELGAAGVTQDTETDTDSREPRCVHGGDGKSVVRKFAFGGIRVR